MSGADQRHHVQPVRALETGAGVVSPATGACSSKFNGSSDAQPAKRRAARKMERIARRRIVGKTFMCGIGRLLLR
jgi:hypothetical protein